MLEGYVAVNPGVRLLRGHRVVIRADVQEYVTTGKVAVVFGGGSGHEPMHTGFVGKGMLTACVCGSVFASPPPQEILPAIRAVAKNNTGGCLLLVANYTGDRLNFGLAFEKARQEGIKIEMVTVAEDCALTSHVNTAGRRALVGQVAISKIAGALAEEGRTLAEIVNITKDALSNMGTIGLSLSACSVPGSGPTFSLGEGQMELGLGAHGEAGVRRMKVTSAKEAVKIMLDHMTSPATSTHLRVESGDKVACFLNNLGGTTLLEMNIIAKEIIQYLDARGVSVDRFYSGHILTSLEMHGVSIMIMHLNDILKQCLDAPTEVPHWPKPMLPRGSSDRKTPSPLDLPDVENIAIDTTTKTNRCFGEADASRTYDALKHACESLISAETRLNTLDTEGGDGDTGSTLARGAREIMKLLGTKNSPGLPVNNPSCLALMLTSTAENCMGGASGALYGLMFTAAASCLCDDLSPRVWDTVLKEAINILKRYGGAEPGDRTMLDSLHAASMTFSERLQNMSPVDAYREAVLAAEKAACETAKMSARAGRASYVNPDLLTQPDPGAVGVTIWMRAVLDSIQ
ncbi:triokinase/FMN cyclase-like [Gigantopelta aegis]|uniref:triokinase/FMN cyclase-like n=1 Tax=Gigantopelta aegis TaxID=1735272 RepID=UPI001B887501|nr:triokinase/FMN cyclase-like [Gigantopelta aegis]